MNKIILFCFILATFPSIVIGQSAMNGVAICTVQNTQYISHLCPDDDGGAIIAWIDYRNVSSTDSSEGADIYAQRFNKYGHTVWTPNGVAICTAKNDQFFALGTLKLVSDTVGGAIITWYDYRSTTDNPTQGADIYAQRINGDGSTLWTANGVAICTAEYDQIYPTIVSDNAGGAIIAWADARNSSSDTTTTTNIYAQRINSTGSTLWTPNGVAICTANNEQLLPYLFPDGVGGAIITWYDYRDTTKNPAQGADIYTQRVNSAGSTLWKENGVAICTAANDQLIPQICWDDNQGAIITWFDYRDTTKNLIQGADIYAQRVNSEGSTLWTLNGVAVCTAIGDQIFPDILSDGEGGAIIGWWDSRRQYNNYAIFAQRINSNGSTLWTTNGVAICTANNIKMGTQLCTDNTGGAIFTWWDYRNMPSNSTTTIVNIYAQRVNSQGSTLWITNGVAICTAQGIQMNPVLTPDGQGGAIITWWDTRNGGFDNADIYAAHVNADGFVIPPVSVPKQIWEFFQ